LVSFLFGFKEIRWFRLSKGFNNNPAPFNRDQWNRNLETGEVSGLSYCFIWNLLPILENFQLATDMKTDSLATAKYWFSNKIEKPMGACFLFKLSPYTKF